MNYPITLSDDLKYLAAYYQWSPEDKVEIRSAFTGSPEMVRFFTVLAAAHRAGYTQCAGNGFIRLNDWCKENGLDDPYDLCFDLKALDALAVLPRKSFVFSGVY